MICCKIGISRVCYRFALGTLPDNKYLSKGKRENQSYWKGGVLEKRYSKLEFLQKLASKEKYTSVKCRIPLRPQLQI
jgi:hypothetical protein